MLSWNLRFEIAHPGPEGRLVQVGGEHPVARDVFVSAAYEIDLVLTSADACPLGIAAPHGPRDDFRAAIVQLVLPENSAELENGRIRRRRDSSS